MTETTSQLCVITGVTPPHPPVKLPLPIFLIAGGGGLLEDGVYPMPLINVS